MKYPFTPEFLDAVPESLCENYRALELTILKRIAEQLQTGKMNEVTIQGIRALRSHGISMEEIEKAIRQTANLSEQEFNEIIQDVIQRNRKYYFGLCTLERITAPQTIVNASIVNALVRQAKGDLRNLARSVGFSVGGRFVKAERAYQWALNNAILQVQNGISYGQAIANATKQLADSGLCVTQKGEGIQYPKHVDKIDVAVRRAVQTAINQINSEYAIESMEYLGVDYVEVSAHRGARNTGEGFENHESWQGKVYYWTQKAKGKNTENAPDFESTCGYGYVTGILGANCRHNFHPYDPDVMERTYSEKDLDELKASEFEYQGRTYDTYTATQKQREIERSVRKWRRREAAATNDADKTVARARILRLNREYKQFSEAAQLRMQKERMKVYERAV